MKVNVVRADPAGNITLFVMDPVEPALRAEVGAKLMEGHKELAAEQVGFACPGREGLDGHMEMMGGEFCGNATRAYGMLMARRRGADGTLRLEVSGCDGPVRVEVAGDTARAEMPLPLSAKPVSVGGAEGVMVDLGGIVHFVTHCQPDESVMKTVEPLLFAPREQGGYGTPEAYGVIFLHDGRMTPLVRVVEPNTLVWEGSCGSGTLAAAIAGSLGTEDGDFSQAFIQPAGTLEAGVTWKAGKVVSAWIGGGVTLGEPMELEI